MSEECLLELAAPATSLFGSAISRSRLCSTCATHRRDKGWKRGARKAQQGTARHDGEISNLADDSPYIITVLQALRTPCQSERTRPGTSQTTDHRPQTTDSRNCLDSAALDFPHQPYRTFPSRSIPSSWFWGPPHARLLLLLLPGLLPGLLPRFSSSDDPPALSGPDLTPSNRMRRPRSGLAWNSDSLAEGLIFPLPTPSATPSPGQAKTASQSVSSSGDRPRFPKEKARSGIPDPLFFGRWCRV